MFAVTLAAIGAGTALGDGAEAPDTVISGEPRVGQTLLAQPVDPTVPVADRYRWQRCDTRTGASCDGAGGRTDPEWDTVAGATGGLYLLTGADLGLHVRVLAKYTSLGSKWEPSTPIGPVLPAAEGVPAGTPPGGGPPPDETLPPPVLHQSANIDPLQGQIFVREPADEDFRRITKPEQIKLGSVLDVSAGHADVTTARNLAGRLQTAEFWAGTFRLTQGEGDAPVTKLKLVGFVGGPVGNRPTTGDRASERRRRGGGRRLWGRGNCKCRSGGRHSSGTVRGTWWLTVDRQDRTVTKVKRGKVKVFDFALRKSFLVKAGEKYVARRR